MKGSSSMLLRVGMMVMLLALVINADAQHLVIDAKKSSINYSIYAHKGGDNVYKGIFLDIKGDIFFDPKQLAKSFFDMTVNASSEYSNNGQRDKDLKGPLFLSAAQYPEIKIKSTSITSDGKVICILHGNLTLKGITKPINIQFTATPIKDGYLFRGSFQLNRLLYNVGQKGDIDNMVTVFVEIKANNK